MQKILYIQKKKKNYVVNFIQKKNLYRKFWYRKFCYRKLYIEHFVSKILYRTFCYRKYYTEKKIIQKILYIKKEKNYIENFI